MSDQNAEPSLAQPIRSTYNHPSHNNIVDNQFVTSVYDLLEGTFSHLLTTQSDYDALSSLINLLEQNNISCKNLVVYIEPGTESYRYHIRFSLRRSQLLALRPTLYSYENIGFDMDDSLLSMYLKVGKINES